MNTHGPEHGTRREYYRAIVVMGVSGCGKSTFGAMLAEALDFPFLEGDQLHPRDNIEKMSRGVPLNDQDRRPWLENIGARLHEGYRGGGIVVSCSALKRSYRDLLRQLTGGPLLFVFLNGKRETLIERMAHRKGHFMPVSLLDSQLATLEDPTTEENVIAIDIEQPSQDNLATVLSRLRQGSDVGSH